MCNQTKSYAVERRTADMATVSRLGTVSKGCDGYRFIPNVSGRKPSRKAHPTMEACLPRWVGYPDRCETRVL